MAPMPRVYMSTLRRRSTPTVDLPGFAQSVLESYPSHLVANFGRRNLRL